MRLKDFPHLQDFPLQNKVEAKKRQFSCQGSAPHFLSAHTTIPPQSSQFKPKQMSQKLCTQHSAKGSMSRAVQHHTPEAAQGSLLQHHSPWQACGSFVLGSSAHSMAPFPKGSPQPIPGKEKHRENLLDFRNITHSKRTPSALAFTTNSWLHWNNFASRYFPPLAIADKDSGLI